MSIVYRPLGAGDVEDVKWALYEAVAWDPGRALSRDECGVRMLLHL